jgi:hypothetical protein
MPAAVRSHEAAVEDQDHILLASKVGQTDRPALEVFQDEIGGSGGGKAWHDEYSCFEKRAGGCVGRPAPALFLQICGLLRET